MILKAIHKIKRGLYFVFFRLNINTIRFNFTYFPLSHAIVFPVFISKKTKLISLYGDVSLPSSIYPGIIQIGYGGATIFDKDRSRTLWHQKRGSVIFFRGNAVIGHGSKINVNENAVLDFGENFNLTAESSIVCYKRIVFGNGCLLSWQILIMDNDGHPIFDDSKIRINPPQEIIISDNVWIGCRVLILKGAFVPIGSVIAAGSIISKKMAEENSIYGGTSNLIKSNIYWEI